MHQKGARLLSQDNGQHHRVESRKMKKPLLTRGRKETMRRTLHPLNRPPFLDPEIKECTQRLMYRMTNQRVEICKKREIDDGEGHVSGERRAETLVEALRSVFPHDLHRQLERSQLLLSGLC